MPAPETVLIAITRAPDCRKGPGLSIMVFVTKSFMPGGGIEFEREPTPENVNFEIAKANFKCTSWRIIDQSELPSRQFRDAWRDNQDHIGHDMPKCREIHRQRLRKQRAPLLAELDVEYMRADESGISQLKKRDIASRKQALRDITADPRIDSAETPEDLLLVVIET